MSAPSSDSAAPANWIIPFFIAAISWGSSFLFISQALQAFGPSQVAFGRVAVGAVVLLGILVVTRDRPRFTWRELGAVAIVGICLSGLPFVLIPLAQLHITSILASLLNASVPLWTALFVALFIPKERATPIQWVGLLMGALGIAVLLGAWDVRSVPLIGAVLMLSATAAYGIGSTLSRVMLSRMKQSPAGLSFAQIGLSAVMLAPLAFLAPAPADDAFDLGTWAPWALLLLGILGTSFAYVMFWRVVQIAGATTGASVTYIVPIIATILGVVVLKERMEWYEPVGALVVLAGVWLAQRKPRVTKAAEVH